MMRISIADVARLFGTHELEEVVVDNPEVPTAELSAMESAVVLDATDTAPAGVYMSPDRRRIIVWGPSAYGYLVAFPENKYGVDAIPAGYHVLTTR